MRTVDKALNLLEHFTIEQPEHGLSELSRMADVDKATTLRMLTSLARCGFVEQHPESKKYRLGKAVLKLARIRETAFPVTSIIQPMLERLAKETGETAHASLASGASLLTVGVAEPQRPTRVHVDASEALPYHATASGIATLAFAAPEMVDKILKAADFSAHTPDTVTSADALSARFAETRALGYAMAIGSYDADVIGIAAPIFDWSGHANGAIAVASIATRMTPESRPAVARAVIQVAIAVTRAMGAEPNVDFMAVAKALLT
jgi:IclR family transcriptional regulator, acetate operon repressor